MGSTISVGSQKMEISVFNAINKKKKKIMVLPGLEPKTSWFIVGRSTSELYFLQHKGISRLRSIQSEGVVIITTSQAKSHEK